MLKARHILAFLAGVLAAAAVWCWPISPLWRIGPVLGWLHGFTPDGRTVITWSGEDKPGKANPVMSRWDADSGRLISRVELPCAKHAGLRHFNEVCPSPDGSRVLVGEGSPYTGGTPLNFSTGEWFVHDGLTGQRLSGPIPGVNRVY